MPRWSAVTAAVVVLAFVAAAIYFAFHESTWYDEACSMTSARGSFYDSLEHALRMELQPPLYFLLLNGWLRIHRSIGFARLLSIPAVIYGALVISRTFARTSREQSPLLYPTVLTIIFASPFTMYLATEARGYALQFALGAMLTSIVASATSRRIATTSDLVGIVAIGTALSYIHYLAGLAAVTVTIALLVWGVLSLRQTISIAVGGALLVAPLAPWIRKHFEGHADALHAPKSRGVLAVFLRLSHLAVPHAIERGPWQWGIAAGIGGAIAVGLFIRLRVRGESLRAKPFILVFGTSVGLFVGFFVCLGFIGGEDAVQERYFAAFLPLILMATLLVMRSSLGWTTTIVLLLTLAAGGAYRIVRIHGPGIRAGDWRRVAERIDRSSEERLPVFVFAPIDALALRVELGDARRVEGFPTNFDGNRAASIADYLVPDGEQLRLRVAKRAGAGPFWLAFTTSRVTLPGIPEPLNVVADFVRSNCVVEEDSLFKGTRLMKLRLLRRER